MVSPFLLREVLDVAIPERDTDAADLARGGMIAIAVVTGALGVGQTWLSNVVGQRVMHDLRTAVYRHLQRLSLAFFTRTRTGEVQSRIANDIGGVQNVVTSTATSIVSNVTDRAGDDRRDVRARLAPGGLLARAPAVLRLAHAARRPRAQARSPRTARRRWPTSAALVEESLSVSGILLGKTMGRSDELAGASRPSPPARRPRGALSGWPGAGGWRRSR